MIQTSSIRKWSTKPNRLFKRLTMVLLMVGCLTVSLSATAQTITYSSKKATLQQVFAEIKKQVNYVVIFNPDLIDVSVSVSVNAQKQPLEAFLKTIFSGMPVKYNIVGTTIVLFRKSDSPQTAMPEDNVPTREVSGIVSDEKNRTPLIGVNVVIAGTNRGTQTNEKGLFTLKNVEENDVLVFSSIGFQKVSVTVSRLRVLFNVALPPATSELDQAVVQAYGITSKRLTTGNITKITAKDIERQPVLNPLLALQGHAPGLLVTQTSGYANAPVKVEIRGRNSIGTNFLSDPLYVIDGVPMTVLDLPGVWRNGGVSTGFVQGGLSATGGQSPLFSMNPRDIESIEVLKDADATAIYGSRAANGVILITTKKGKPGKTNFSLDVNQGYIDVPHRRQMLNTQQYLQMRREAFKNDGITPTKATAPDLVAWDTTRYTDWQKEILGTGSQTTINTSLSGGDAQNTFRISGNYGKQVDVLSKSGASQQATLGANIGHKSQNQKLSVNLGTQFSYTHVNAIYALSSVFQLPPNAPPIYNSKGELNWDEWNAVGKGNDFPFGYLLKTNVLETNQFSSNLGISYELLKGLTVSTSAGYTSMTGSSNFFIPIASQNPIDNPMGSTSFGTTKNTNWIIEPQIAYSRYVGKGDLKVQLGGSLQSTITDGVTTFGLGYTDDNMLSSINNAMVQQTTENYARYKYAGMFGRINYNWNNKYIINLNARRDGSSRFAAGSQFGNFGSVGLAWNASEEPWMKQLLPNWVSFMKLRTSYGITGGDGSIGDYQYLSQWSTKISNVPLNQYGGLQPLVPIHAVNQQYHWESNKKYEAALSVSFLEDRINLEGAYYMNRSGNQVTSIPTPRYTGFSSIVGNWNAVIENAGWEGDIRATLVQKKDLRWSVTFNISTNKNRLISYPGIEQSPYYTIYRVGESLSAVYLTHYLGIDPQTGRYSFVDRNKDGQIIINSNVPAGTANDDRYIVKDLNPKYYGGIGTALTYKGWNLDLFFDYKRQLGMNPFLEIPGGFSNLPVSAIRDHWQKPGDIAAYPGYSTSLGTSISSSDAMYVNASYLRFRTLALSYGLPDNLLKRMHMTACRAFIRAQNLFTITNYPGIDPEIQDLSSVPPSRTITGGLSFNF
ncbi:TonB-linked SusC/RagA family outer membrane protein [Chitinophaga dinghuensis]|uniref:TonB-linked SusC/RagA family outer membrane protein n=1 Tax=Chitinophaga dinghuensis TaxID=1539050 RepID=A0A327VQX3_9BACT|nr:SusC/RagA family TonB-linked outer membrane protein [Chitinophaga dinghuensis]RAJ76777.1 TonB-linked SusC/RagA family outer membrane protein [Chitinophaga dinghuensis]